MTICMYALTVIHDNCDGRCVGENWYLIVNGEERSQRVISWNEDEGI